MKAKSKKKKLAYFIDIQKNKKISVLDLRKKTKIIKWLILSFILVISGWFFYGAVLKADIIYFYPNSVLGTWFNVDKSIGQPDLDFEEDIKYFNENNSAIFEGGGIKQIFLGNFQNPSLAEIDNKKITNAILRINFRIGDKNDWLMAQQEFDDVNLIEPTMMLVPPEESPVSTETIVPSPLPAEENIESLTPTENVESTPTIEEAPTPEQTPLPISLPIQSEEVPTPLPSQSEEPTSTPLSLLKIFLKKVLAQETFPSESPLQNNSVSTSTLESTSTPESTFTSTPTPFLETILSTTTPTFPTETPFELEISPIPTETFDETIETFKSTTTETSVSKNNFSTEITPIASSTPVLTPLFVIRYTLDGENWQVLTSIDNKENYPTEFELPISEWSEIDHLQISIESTLNTNLEDNLIAFLDGAQLEIEYKSTEEPTEEVTVTPSPTPFQFPFEIQQILDILKTKIKEPIDISNLKTEKSATFSCAIEPFTTEIKEGAVKEARIILNKNPKALIEKIIIGNLPQGMEIFFEKNNDYMIQLDKEEQELILKIISLPNSQKGNFSIPIIYQTDNEMTMCQINVVNF